MAIPLRPLQLLCERRATLFKHVPEFLKSSSEISSTAATSSSSQDGQSQIEHLDTTYGLRLSFKNGQIIDVRHLLPSPEASSSADPPTGDSSSIPVDNVGIASPKPSKPAYWYRIWPDWGTSHFWNEECSDEDGEWEHHVDGDVIESRYPALAPSYIDWATAYDIAFEEQECDQGSHAEVFADPRDDAVWEMEGCLMAFWLVLREDVEHMEYWPHIKKYSLMANNLVDVLKEVLKDTETRLQERLSKESQTA